MNGSFINFLTNNQARDYYDENFLESKITLFCRKRQKANSTYWIFKCRQNKKRGILRMSVERTYIETYAPDSDMTFIVEDTLVNGEVAFSEVKGFYHGKPNPQSTEKYYNRLKAEYKI